ncbi:MAG: hexameric tyrosine-coordinated heme protein [Rhodobacteraceae bacterium]|nr:hexameric tyrosine-coordinated heme protein [Paracoccaceae bacterium]
MSETWLPSLITKTPQEGYELAVKLSRVAVKMTQPDPEIRDDLRKVYESDADALIAVSAVVATHYQTVAAANNYWR